MVDGIFHQACEVYTRSSVNAEWLWVCTMQTPQLAEWFAELCREGNFGGVALLAEVRPV